MPNDPRSKQPEEARHRAELPWSLEAARNGEPVLKLAGRATDSLYRPSSNAERTAHAWFEEGRNAGSELFVLVGAGLGRWLDAFAASAGKGGEALLVWDPFPGVRADLARQHGDLAQPSKTGSPDKNVVVVETAEDFDQALERLHARPHAASVRVHPGYESICRFELRYAARALRQRSTVAKPQRPFSECVVNERGLRALRSLPLARPIEALTGRLEGGTAVIASAGPSLRPAREVLAREPGGARLVAVQRIGVFQQCGARADFAICADPSDLFERCKIPPDAPYGALIADTACSPAMLEPRLDHTYLYHLRSPDLQEHAWESAGYATLDEPCLTVSEIGVLLAKQMGARRIVLVGVDYGADDPRYRDRFPVAGAQGESLPTNAHYFHGARYLSHLCPRLADEGIEIHRLGDNGVPIAGVNPIDLEGLTRLLAEAPPCPPIETGPTCSAPMLEAVEQSYRALRARGAAPGPEDTTGFGADFEAIAGEQQVSEAEAGLEAVGQLRARLTESRALVEPDQGFGSRQTPPFQASTT